MRNRMNPWVVVLTAALTFGSLMAFIGPRSFGHYRGHWSPRHGLHGQQYGNYSDRADACYDRAGNADRQKPTSPENQ